MKTPTLMFQGTGSDVGKSLVVAGLARALTNQGLVVRPFKPQNMSNNAAVTREGGEIGRAQALQAQACRVEPHTDMNPVLLKPETETGAQIIVRGQMTKTLSARDYVQEKPALMKAVMASYHALAAQADLVLVEGAGSPAESNLRAHDIANMGFASAADIPVILIGDIDRGGVIASLAGTAQVIAAAEKTRIKGFLINKFRGDISLFDGGIKHIEALTGWPSLGVIPYFAGASKLPAEDAVALGTRQEGVRNGAEAGDGTIKIAVPMLSRISNFDDFDPLAMEPDVTLSLVKPGMAIPICDLIILPGTKSTIGDMKFIRAQGWDIDIQAHARRGDKVLGICGGYQMLGTMIHGSQGIEGTAESIAGLGLLDVETIMGGDKVLREVTGSHSASGAAIRGYEMHIGHSRGPDCRRAFLDLKGGDDGDHGACSADHRIMGCYVHGLFAADPFRRRFLAELGAQSDVALDFDAAVDAVLDELAAHMARAIDLEQILRIARGG